MRRRLWGNLSALLLLAVFTLVFIGAYRQYYKAAYPLHYRQQVLAYGSEYGVSPALVFAVIRTESGFNPNAVSSVKARGLMQITQDTFEWAQLRIKESERLHFDDLFQSELNIRYGAAILGLLMQEFGTEQNALCAYHAGWGNLKRWLQRPELSPDGVNLERIPFADTGHYVQKVTKTKTIYQTLYHLPE